MPNLYKNKVVYGNTVLIDITDTTAEASDVAVGKYFYEASGQRVIGTASVYDPDSALLHVTAPVGSTITLSKSSVVVKVLGPEQSHVNSTDTELAEWYYPVSAGNFGTWNITATRPSDPDPANGSMTIDSNKQYDIVLEYGLVLFYRGEEKVTWGAYGRSGGSQGYGGQAPSVGKYTDHYSLWFSERKGGIFATADKIDLSHYATLKAEITGVTNSGNINFGALDRTAINMNGGTGAASVKLATSAEEHKITSVNIASVSSSQHIGFWLYAASGAGITNLWKVWLEK